MRSEILTDLFKWLCGLWLGAMLFFTAAATPLIFSSFDKAEAGRIVSAIFPGYYLANHLGFLLTALAAAAALRSRAQNCGLRAALALLVIAWAVGPAFNHFWLAPYLRELKAAGEIAAFGKWHGLSMALNLAAVLLVAAAPWQVKAPDIRPSKRAG